MTKRNATKRKQMRRRKMRRMIDNFMTVCSVVVLLVCATYLIHGAVMHNRGAKMTDDIRGMYHNMYAASAENLSSPNATIAPTAAESTAAAETESADSTLPTEKPLIPVNLNEVYLSSIVDQVLVPAELVMQPQFEQLFERNNDLVGWIHVNDDIDYPIVWRDEDNDFYMNHDYDGNFSEAGWIFLDKRNEADMFDDQMLIYGHNMRRGTMFGELDLYRELDYVQQHPIIEVQSIYDVEPRKYVIVSLFDASMNKSHETYIKITNFNFETPEAKQAYIDAMCGRSDFNLPFDANSDDQLITLVTCSYTYPNGRFLVVARELREGETVEMVQEAFDALN